MKKLMISAVLVGFAAASVFGADLVNKESTAKKVRVDYGHDIVVEYNHRPGYTYKNICSNCKVTTDGVELSISGDDRAVIQNGKVIAEE